MSFINDSTRPAVFTWLPACWLQVKGPDAAAFLQGQFTNDLRGLEPGGAVYGLWLSVKGKVVGDSFVLRGREEGAFWIASYHSPAATIRERLEGHIIADDVTVEDLTATVAGLSVWGGSEQPAPAEGFRFPGRRTREPNTEWIFPREKTAAVRAQLSGAYDVAAEELARWRIDVGLPEVPVDLGPGDLPHEAGLEADAISYTKGCYLGQEVMARLKSMGQVRRRLLRVEIAADELPALPAPLFAGARPAGELRSAARAGPGRFVGLAMLSLLQVPESRRLALAPGGAVAVAVSNFP